MGKKEGEWYEKYIHMYVFVREGVKKKKKIGIFPYPGGGGQPHSLSFFLSYLKYLSNNF